MTRLSRRRFFGATGAAGLAGLMGGTRVAGQAAAVIAGVVVHRMMSSISGQSPGRQT